MQNWRDVAQLIWNETLDLIFPPQCHHCGRVDTHFCDGCIAVLKTLSVTPIESSGIAPLYNTLSTGKHEALLQASVQVLKYNGQQSIGEVFADRILATLATTMWTIDTVVPVPLHTSRFQERGYNQAESISHHVATKGDFVHAPDALTRITQTRSQVGLSARERQHNVQGAFTGDATQLQGQQILLIDDVKTTGATLAACAQALLEAGATGVQAITVTVA